MLNYYHANKFLLDDKFDVFGWVNYILELNDKNHINTLSDPEEQLSFSLAYNFAKDVSDEIMKDILDLAEKEKEKQK